MILASVIFIWLGVATVYTMALCRAASGPIPSPTTHANDGAELVERSPGEPETGEYIFN